jgi:menaquinone-9 beta-reductase
MKKVIIIGGGLAGLISAIRLTRFGISCTLFEKKQYPFHRVCGEYISNETMPFLKRENLFPSDFLPPFINQFTLSSVSGKSKKLTLDLGGFGISRYVFDHFLYQQALKEGVEIVHREVDNIFFNQERNQLEVIIESEIHLADYVIGSFGKRSKLDIGLNRSFIRKRSPYVGVKYHILTNHPANEIALHNFNGGYCGISNIEEGKTNLCYLVHRDQVRRHKTIPELEEQVLFRNPFLKSVFMNSAFLFEKPETINEISFETKEPVLNHILMAGDAAGMITPLCGNGMALAIHSGKLVSDLIIQAKKENHNRKWVEQSYWHQWTNAFSQRLRIGRLVQNTLFGSEWSSRVAVSLAIQSEPIAKLIIRNTHGAPF